MQHKLTLLALLGAFSVSATAENWIDKQHKKAEENIDHVASKIDNWFGRVDLDNPGTATLRIMLDNQWNRYDGYSVKPRVRAKIKLPTLKKRFSLVVGDEDLDNRAPEKTQIVPNYMNLEKGQHYNHQQARNDSASVALRWSNLSKRLGVETDFDIGLRSGGDVYGRLKLKKNWQIDEKRNVQAEQIYRYGSNSKHYLRTSIESRYSFNAERFVANLTFLEYFHDIDESLFWGNSTYQQHDFGNHKTLTYGLFAGGRIEHKQPHLNGYGPFITWRQPILREWLFLQAELNFYNNKEKERKHHPAGFLRLEAIF